MATTPPPPTTLRTPPTPRHGPGYEGYDPYVTRRSPRIASRRAVADPDTTPPPSSPTQLQAPGDMSGEGSLQTNPSAMGALSPPSSTQNSPRKRSGRVKVDPSHSLAINNERHFRRNTNTSPRATQNKNNFTHNNNPAIMADETLPTPVKTPSKKMIPDSKEAARVLFPNKPSAPEDTPSKKGVKKGKKFSAFSLESFNETGGTEAQGNVQIFTDSRDRIPELDESEDNPFYQKPNATKDSEVKGDAAVHTTKRRKVEEKSNTKRDKEVQDAINRDDGMFYVFRGKKIFRKFDEDFEDQDEYDDEGLLAGRSDAEDMSSSARPLTRASIKPRLLFPTAEQRQAREQKSVVTDEEATTDIEEHADADEVVEAPAKESGNEVGNGVTESEPTTPTNQTTQSTVTTPTTPKFSGHGHSLRSQSKKSVEQTPVKNGRASTNTSFGSWKRTKSSSDESGNTTPKTRKRGVPSGDHGASPAKKKPRNK